MARAGALAGRIAAGIGIGIVVLLVLAVLVLTQTDFARDRVRTLALDAIAAAVNGRVSIGRLEGNVLSHTTLRDVEIEDSAGGHFLTAESVSFRYSILPVIGGRLILRDVRVENPVITLNQPPGGQWNFVHLFPQDSAAPAAADTGGFGSYIRLDGLTIVNAAVTVRLPWSPADSLEGEARRAAIERELGTDSRLSIIEVPGGYQMRMVFRDLDAELPTVRLAHPDSAARIFDIATASLTAYPFRPPAAIITNLSGHAALTDDSLVVRDVEVALPASELAGDVAYALESGGFRADIGTENVQFSDLDWIQPDLPDGRAKLHASVQRDAGMMHVVLRDMNVVADTARLSGGLEIAFGDTLRIGDTDLTFSNVDTRLLERLARNMEVPVDGTLRGRVELRGDPESLDVNGWTEFAERSGSVSRVEVGGGLGTDPDGALRAESLRLTFDPVRASLLREFGAQIAANGAATGTATLNGPLQGELDVQADLVHYDPVAGRSRILADGGVNVTNAVLRNLRLRLAPLRVGLLRTAAPNLPVGGIIEGNATLNGSPTTRLSARVDVAHTDTTGQSVVSGSVAWIGRATPSFELDLRLEELSLATVGRFAPAAALEGSVNGFLRASGTLERPTFAFEILTSENGRLAAEGVVERQRSGLLYDTRMVLAGVDAGTLSAKSPHTNLTGSISVEGEGTDPATARMTIAADLVDLLPDTMTLDTFVLRASLADGVAAIQRAHLSSASASADIEGTIGVVEGRTGELRYSLAIDSLVDFQRFMTDATDTIVARPLIQARRLAAARADSLRLARATEIERAATGYPPRPQLEVDSIPPIAPDSLSGTLRADGVLTGSFRRFGARGNAVVENLIAAGANVVDGRAEYTMVDFGTPDADFEVELDLGAFAAAGFAFDSATASLAYRGLRNQGNGRAAVSLFQDPDRDYRLASEFLLELDRREVTFAELVLRFDTVQWTAPRPGSIAFADGDITVDSLELVTGESNGRILVDGVIPDAGAIDLYLDVERLPLGQVAALLQDTSTATGLLDLQARIRGTRSAPLIEGTSVLVDGSLAGRPLPDMNARFDYAGRQFNTVAQLSGETGTYLTADARLPLDLSLDSVSGPRFYNGPLHVSVLADSLPLEALPSFTDALADVRGRIRSDVTITGTRDAPILEGFVNLDLASLSVVPAGLALTDLAGAMRFEGDNIFVDSLRTMSGGGPIWLAGTIDATTLTRPTFDLELNAQRALILNNDQGRVRTDAELTITGPLDSTRIEGTARIREGVLYAPQVGEKKRYTTLADPEVLAVVDTGATPTGLLPEPNPLMQNLVLDMGVTIDHDVWVRNTDTNIEVYTPARAEALRVRMNGAEPGLSLEGVINADRGEYTFSGRVFQLTTGSVVFVPGTGLDPLLQLTANYEVAQPGREALVIQIHVTGTMSEPRLSLESSAEPPLSESDLLSYLAFGRSSSGLLSLGGSGLSGGGNGGSDGIGALAQQQLASLALGAMLDEAVADIERQGSRAGFDMFRVNPADLPAELAFSGQFGNFLRGTEIVVGKYVTPRWFVAAEGRTTTETWPGFRVEYVARGGFSWVTTWEPRYLPIAPALGDQTARSTRAFGSFLTWTRRF